MIGYEARWHEPASGQTHECYYCGGCGVPVQSPTAPPRHVSGPLVLPANAVCARCGHKPGSKDRAEQPKPLPAAMFGTSQQALIAALRRLGEYHCHYAGGEWKSRRCDCKFGTGYLSDETGEETGCPELRQAYEMVRAMTAAEFAHICSQASISTAQEPTDG